MDIIEIWENSPVWFKVDLVIIHIASVYTAIRILLPAIKWVNREVKSMFKWFDPEGRIIWLRFKPKISLLKKPILSVSSESGDRKKWTIQIFLLLKGNDIKNSEITLTDFYILIEQGWGKRKIRIKLKPIFSNYHDETILLREGQIEKKIVLDNFTKPDIPESDIDLNKSFKWKAVGIRGRVFGTHSRFISSFRGQKDDIQIKN